MESEKLEVVQDDRNAAIELLDTLGFPHIARLFNPDLIAPDSLAEEALLVLARHRLTAEAAIVAWLKQQSIDAETEGGSIALWEAADAISKGAHHV